MHLTRIKGGRPRGSRTFDAVIASAFGSAVREARLNAGVSQEDLAAAAGIERSHVGKIERGEHLPTIVALFKLSQALGCGAFELVGWTEALLPPKYLRTLTE